MRTLRRSTVLPVVVAAAAVSLTACQDDGGKAPAATDAATSSSSAKSATSAEAPSTAAPSTSADDRPTTQVPTSSREDSRDTSSLDAETSALPAGPVKTITIKKLGGYETEGGGHGNFYAVLDVDSSGPGLLDLEYVLLDKSGKALKTVKDNIAVGGTKDELKITQATGQLPPASEGKVAKVRLRVTKNAANQFATVTMIDPKITTSIDPASKVPVVNGRYKTSGKASVVNLNAICSDAKGRVIAGDSPVDKIKSPTWTGYQVRLFNAPDGYQPTKCYVGS
jgi:hypothetical protein